MSKENKRKGGVYGGTKTNTNGNRTIGQSNCYENRGKRRLKDEKAKAYGKEISDSINGNMSIVACTVECVEITKSDGFRDILETAKKLGSPRLLFHSNWGKEKSGSAIYIL
jgi:hypothetical protein